MDSDELEDYVPHRAYISRAHHGPSGDIIFGKTGATSTTASLNLPIASSASVGLELQVGHYPTPTKWETFYVFFRYVQEDGFK